MANKIKFYTEDAEWTAEGKCYKNDMAFKSGIGICYISEGQLVDLEDIAAGGGDLSCDEMVKQCYAETRQSILKAVKLRWDEFNEEDKVIGEERVARAIYNSLAGESVEAKIEHLTMI